MGISTVRSFLYGFLFVWKSCVLHIEMAKQWVKADLVPTAYGHSVAPRSVHTCYIWLAVTTQEHIRLRQTIVHRF